MFAVIRTGGKQYRVVKDDKIIVEKIIGEPGSMIELSDVLMIGGEKEKLSVGSPVVDKLRYLLKWLSSHVQIKF